MKFYKPYKDDKQICLLCQHYCKLKAEQVGICGVNKNIGDKVECLVYGYPAVLHVDPVEKKPLYHFLPNTNILSLGTVGCNFACPFCQNHGISQEHNINKTNYRSPEDIVSIALKNGCKSIAFTYNEPTIFYPYARDIALLAKKNGLKNVFVSNGFESDEVIDDMVGIIDAANIDLKSFDEKYYKKDLKGDLNKLLKNIKKFHENRIWIEITTLIIPTKNDSDEELEEIAKFIASVDVKIPWHLSAFHPDYKELQIQRTPPQTLKRAYDIGKRAGLKYVYMGNAGLDNPTQCIECGCEIINRVTYKIKKDIRQNGDRCPKCQKKLDGVFMSKRDTAVAGTFYPNSCAEIKKYIEHFSNLLSNSNFNPNLEFTPRAVIVPHAGYVYSGFTANVAYSLLKNLKPKRVLVIGPSHKVYLEGASVATFDEYSTPCGNIDIDTNYAKKLIEKFDFINFIENAHHEHSTETQIPFVKHYFPNSKVLEIVYGKVEYQDISKVIDMALEDNGETFVVISTDLSHFYDLEKAKRLDNICLAGIDKLNIDIWNKGCEACGRVGVKAMIESANKLKLSSKLLDYRTSFDITKDDKSVVGYTSAVLG